MNSIDRAASLRFDLTHAHDSIQIVRGIACARLKLKVPPVVIVKVATKMLVAPVPADFCCLVDIDT